MNILELSYKHLLDVLEPCFLYFGVFHQGKIVKVQKITHLWVAEGFIPEILHGKKSPEDVENEFLMDLFCRSLLIVVKRRSNNGIKNRYIHDFLFYFSLAELNKRYSKAHKGFSS